MGEPSNPTRSIEVLDYSIPDRDTALSIPMWMKISLVVASLILFTIYVIGLPPFAGAIDYTKDFRLVEVIEYGRKQGIRGTFRNLSMIYHGLFVPAALLGLVVFFAAPTALVERFVVFINILLPTFWLTFYLPIFMVIGPFIIVESLFGKLDGETWSEGFVCWSAMGSWSTLWLAVGLAMFILHRQRAHLSRP